MNKKIAVLAGLAATIALTGAATVPAQAAKPEPISAATYTALGDSFAAGFGAGAPILVNGMPTGQFTGAYPLVLASGSSLNFRALPGATTGDIPAQIASVPGILPEMPSGTQQVTLTVGGNDLGFVEKAQACADPTVSCALTAEEGTALGALPGNLASTIDAIHQQAPNATIYVTGYPLLFQATPGSGQCVVGTLNGNPYAIGESKANQLDAAAVALNTAIKSAIAGPVHRYAKYVDVTAAFAGHGLCGADSYINPVIATLTPTYEFEVDSSNGPLHPTLEGQQAYAQSILAKGFKG